MSGRLIAVVGPSGVGKDRLIAEIRAARPAFRSAQRCITRPADPSEPFEPVSTDTFARMRAAGAFALDWSAHGLHYGILAETHEAVRRGEDVLANLSRSVLGQAARRYGRLTILSVSASPGTLAARLSQRGRESSAEITRRLARPVLPFPEGAKTIPIDNDGEIGQAVRVALRALDSQAAE